MNIVNIQTKLQEFSKNREWDKYHSPKNLVMALSGEIGELNEIFQWLNEKESENLSNKNKDSTKDEIADIAIYLINLCMKLDINLEDAILDKIKKNEEKYPIEKIKGNFKKYTEL